MIPAKCKKQDQEFAGSAGVAHPNLETVKQKLWGGWHSSFVAILLQLPV